MIIDLNGAVGEDFTAAEVKQALADANGADVTMRVNSPGGEVRQGFEIANAIEDYSGKVTALLDSQAYSIASVFPLAAAEVISYRNTTVMIHNAWAFAFGDAAEFRSVAQALSVFDGIIADIYAEKSGKPKSFWADLMDAETWLDSAQAMEYGLVDAIKTRANEPKPADKHDRKPVKARFAAMAKVDHRRRILRQLEAKLAKLQK